MGRKNRRNSHEGNRVLFWGVPLMTLAAALGMVYLHLFNTCENIGREIKRLESERAELRKRVVNEELNWGTASSIRNVEQLMARHGIAMSFPEERHIIRMVPKPEEPVQYAHNGASMRRD